MTPHRNKARVKRADGTVDVVAVGTFVVDRRLKHIGRVHKATGITNAATFKAFNNALPVMASEPAGREWIRLFARDAIDGVALWGVYSDGRWRKAPEPMLEQELVKAVTAWREDTKDEVAEATYIGRKHLIAQLTAAAPSGATLADLPNVFRDVKRRMKKAPVAFNTIRNYLRAFLRDTMGTRHELYLVLKHDILPIEIPGHAKKKEKKRHPLSPAEVQLLASKFANRRPNAHPGGHGYNVIQMALLGTNPKEYFVDGWTVGPTFVKIEGEKRSGRTRMVPKLFPCTLWPHATLRQPTVNEKSFDRAFREARKAANLVCTPMDLRRSFSNWMEESGIDRTRRRMYMGHVPRDVTDLYETKKELLRYLPGDGEKLRAWIEEQLRAAAAATAPVLSIERGR